LRGLRTRVNKPRGFATDALDNLCRAVIGPLDFSYTLDSQGRANQMFAV
jgi:hypothetical protein